MREDPGFSTGFRQQGGGPGGTKITEDCMKTKELGFLRVPNREGFGGGTTLFQNFGVGDTADRGGSPHPPVGKTL